MNDSRWDVDTIATDWSNYNFDTALNHLTLSDWHIECSGFLVEVAPYELKAISDFIIELVHEIERLQTELIIAKDNMDAILDAGWGE